MTDIRKSMRQVLEEINSSEIEKLQELALDENTDAAIRKKAEKSGMPFGILKKVFNRGVARKVVTDSKRILHSGALLSKFLCNKIVWYMG